MSFENFWYVVALSQQLTNKSVLARTLLNEWLVIFRDSQGNPVALQDRCLHRNSRLSAGKLQAGTLQCPYHGWQYDGKGKVVAVPAEGPSQGSSQKNSHDSPNSPCHKVLRQAKSYATREQDGYIYVCLAQPAADPFVMPHYRASGWSTIRVINRFNNSVTNCAENFIDIPHTASVHPGIFRKAKQQPLKMTVERSAGNVSATYHQETNNLGWFSWFLNPQGKEISHVDSFYMPNVTSVEYDIGPFRRCFITSQSIPESDTHTLVYTDVTFKYGIWNLLARPFIRWTAQKIIAQDIVALQRQQETIEKYGERFTHTPADTIHVFVESIREALAQGKDPCQLPDKSVEVTFWV
jgi:phenylpropionate dioxygenase-like ring-hydroxylating dioxygenase large terminal subunit